MFKYTFGPCVFSIEVGFQSTGLVGNTRVNLPYGLRKMVRLGRRRCMS